MSHGRFRQNGALWSACAAYALLASTAAAAENDAQQAAQELTQRHGLVKITGRVWGLPSEEELRQRLKRLPELRHRIVAAEKELDDRIAHNAQAWQEARPTIEALRAQIARLSTGDPQRSVLEEQLKAISAVAAEPATLASRDPVRLQLAHLGQDRCMLALDLAWIHRTTPSLEEHYRQLAANGEIVGLIQQTGERSRLGPARNYAAEASKLEDYERLAHAPHVPIYLQSQRLRLAAAVNDAACVTFTWSPASDAATFVPASVIEAAGIEIPAGAPRKTLRIEGRTVEVREITLSLRLGGCQVPSIVAYALPPEAEDLGAQLAAASLSPCRPIVELERLRMVFGNDQ